MSFRNTLQRILLILQGQTALESPVVVTNTEPKNNDSKETLALKWEAQLRP
jgi:hypothetical protein